MKNKKMILAMFFAVTLALGVAAQSAKTHTGKGRYAVVPATGDVFEDSDWWKTAESKSLKNPPKYLVPKDSPKHPTIVPDKAPPAAALLKQVATGSVSTRDFTATEIFWQKVSLVNPVLALLVVCLAGLTFTVMLRRKKGRIYIKAQRWRSWWFAGDGDEEKPDSELSGAQKIWKRTACFLGL